LYVKITPPARFPFCLFLFSPLNKKRESFFGSKCELTSNSYDKRTNSNYVCASVWFEFVKRMFMSVEAWSMTAHNSFFLSQHYFFVTIFGEKNNVGIEKCNSRLSTVCLQRAINPIKLQNINKKKQFPFQKNNIMMNSSQESKNVNNKILHRKKIILQDT